MNLSDDRAYGGSGAIIYLRDLHSDLQSIRRPVRIPAGGTRLSEFGTAIKTACCCYAAA
jgi:hypothetical protein